MKEEYYRGVVGMAGIELAAVGDKTSGGRSLVVTEGRCGRSRWKGVNPDVAVSSTLVKSVPMCPGKRGRHKPELMQKTRWWRGRPRGRGGSRTVGEEKLGSWMNFEHRYWTNWRRIFLFQEIPPLCQVPTSANAKVPPVRQGGLLGRVGCF